MAKKNTADVLINGKVYTISGYESTAYLQKVATYLNEMEEFHEDTSIENITEVFYEKLSQAFANEGWNLTKIEVGENPLRVYIIQTNHI